MKGQTAVVTAVTDGDGATLRTKAGEALNCRIDMIDAPETAKTFTKPPQPGQPGGRQSKKSLQELIESKEVTVYVTKSADKDNYGRSLCQVEIQGVDVGMEQIRTGMAYVYERFVDKAQFPESYAAQDAAKKGRKGIHAVEGLEKPEQYRRRYKQSP